MHAPRRATVDKRSTSQASLIGRGTELWTITNVVVPAAQASLIRRRRPPDQSARHYTRQHQGGDDQPEAQKRGGR
jgi:hypothetical protein